MLWAVELRREESRCQLQDLIRPAQLPILRTKFPHFRRFHTRRPRPRASVHFRLSHPVVDGLRRTDPKFRRHRLNGRPLRSMLRPNLRHHPNSTVPQLLRVAPRSSRHDPILPKRRSLRQTRGDSQTDDQLLRGRNLGQLGRVALEHCYDAIRAGQPADVQLAHLNAALHRYQAWLELIPADAVDDLTETHGQLGAVYDTATRFDPQYLDTALHHYRQAIQYATTAGNTYRAGLNRYLS